MPVRCLSTLLATEQQQRGEEVADTPAKPAFKRRRASNSTPQKLEKTLKRTRADKCWAQSAASTLEAWQASITHESGTDIVLGDVREPALHMAKAYVNALAADQLGSELASALQAAALDLVQLTAAAEATAFTPAADVSSRYTARLADGRVWALQKVWYDALAACSNMIGADKQINTYFHKKQDGLQMGTQSSDLAERLLTLESGGCSVSGMGFLSRASASVCQVAAITIGGSEEPTSGSHGGLEPDVESERDNADSLAVVLVADACTRIGSSKATQSHNDSSAPSRQVPDAELVCTDPDIVAVIVEPEEDLARLDTTTIVGDNDALADDSDEDTPLTALEEEVAPLTSLT